MTRTRVDTQMDRFGRWPNDDLAELAKRLWAERPGMAMDLLAGLRKHAEPQAKAAPKSHYLEDKSE